MYKVDTNGDNMQKLSDNDCFNITYINGWLYYSVRGEDENKLYCVREDGKYEQRLTESYGTLCQDDSNGIEFIEDGGFWFISSFGSKDDYVYDGEWVYYSECTEENEQGADKGVLMRVRMTDSGEAVKEKVSGNAALVFYRGGRHGVSFKDGALYFMSGNKYFKDVNAPDSVYRFKDGELKNLSGDVNIYNFGFSEDGRLVFAENTLSEREFEDDYRYTTSITAYICDENDENPQIWEEAEPYIKKGLENEKKSHDEWLANRDKEEEENNTDEDFPEDVPQECVLGDISDDRFTVYYTYFWKRTRGGGWSGSSEKLYVRDSAGNETLVSDNFEGVERIDDVLYFGCDNFSNGGSQNALMSYDLNTGEKRIIADDIRRISYVSTDLDDTDKRWILYTDANLNMCRYDIKEDKCSQIFPNSSSKKYGEFCFIVTFGEIEGVYKVDADGNLTTLTDTLTMYPQYVPNGAKRGNYGTLYEMKKSKEALAENEMLVKEGDAE